MAALRIVETPELKAVKVVFASLKTAIRYPCDSASMHIVSDPRCIIHWRFRFQPSLD
jgi:hypothetical protein